MNPVLTAAVLAWLLAQSTKVMVGLLRYGLGDRSRLAWRFLWAGGMPSAHSALISSCALTICLSGGMNTPLFGLALITACIVVYDRSRMYAIYATFQQRYPRLRQEVQKDPVLKDLVGHRPSEIGVGIAIGIGAGFMVSLFGTHV